MECDWPLLLNLTDRRSSRRRMLKDEKRQRNFLWQFFSRFFWYTLYISKLGKKILQNSILFRIINRINRTMNNIIKLSKYNSKYFLCIK